MEYVVLNTRMLLRSGLLGGVLKLRTKLLSAADVGALILVPEGMW
jgi:hypothetical protein